MDAELARFIAGSSDNASLPRAPNRDRPPAQHRIIALLHGRIKRIHIDMDDSTSRQTRFGFGWHKARILSESTVQVSRSPLLIGPAAANANIRTHACARYR
jgi:hypothetical protein